MLALTPGDFDFDKGEVRINKTFYILKGKHYITSPKTIKSVRKIKMPKFLCDELQDYLQLVFLPSDDIEVRMFPVTKSSVNRALKRGTKKAGLPEIRVHDLRHPYVKPTTKKFASFLKFFRAAAIAARSCSIRYSWLMLPFQISPFLKSPA